MERPFVYLCVYALALVLYELGKESKKKGPYQSLNAKAALDHQ